MLGAIPLLAALNLPALAPDEALKRSPDAHQKMVVSGHVTSEKWPGKAPAAHRLKDGRVLLHDSHDANLVWIWSPKTKKLVPLGKATLAEIPRTGALVATYEDERTTYHDVDPTRNALRALWTEPPDTERLQTWVAGATTSGSPVLITRTTKGVTMVTIRDPGAVESREISLPATKFPASADALRGNRLLVIEGNTFTGAMETPVVKVSVLDVVTGEIRDLGEAKGCHTSWTGGIHSFVDVTWKDHDPHVKRPGREPHCPVLVDPETGAVEEGPKPELLYDPARSARDRD